jgi:hypothetical protein
VHLPPPSPAYATRTTKIAELNRKEKLTSKERAQLAKMLASNKKGYGDIEGRSTRGVIKALDRLSRGYWVLSVLMEVY